MAGFFFLVGDVGGLLPTDASLNVFDDMSCFGAGCIGKTMLGTWHSPHNGAAAPFGSYYPCYKIDFCTPAVLAGNGVMNWVVNPDNTYSLDYSWNAGSGAWAGVPLVLHIEGQIIRAGCPVVDGVWKNPYNGLFYMFGANLTHMNHVMINGVDITVFQELNNGELFLSAVPPNWTRPWTVTLTNTEGCSGSFPQPCPQ